VREAENLEIREKTADTEDADVTDDTEVSEV
jgi:hypothetical protein